MNVRSAILQRLESGQATLEQLLELDYLDRLISRTLKRMVRHARIEEYAGVYAIVGQLVKVEPVAPPPPPTPPVPAPVVPPAPVIPAPVSPFVPAVIEEEVAEVFEIMEEAVEENDMTDLLDLLDNSVKYIVTILPTLSQTEVALLKEAEEAGKTRKSLIAAINKLEG